MGCAATILWEGVRPVKSVTGLFSGRNEENDGPNGLATLGRYGNLFVSDPVLPEDMLRWVEVLKSYP